MARPAGRYFASVIAKIRDAKKKEQIVVDDAFKLRLRQQVMMKISVGVQPERVSWMERLAPFKSYLAVVPALALVLVAVAGISKLPIDFKSGVVVPTAPSQENVQPSVQSVSDVPVSNDQPVSGIKTFPGRFVIPSNYFAGNQNNQGSANVFQDSQPQSYVSVDQTAQAPEAPVSSVPVQNPPVPTSADQPEQKETTINVPDQIFQYFAFQPNQNFSNVGEGNVVVSPSPMIKPVTSASAPLAPSVSGSTPLSSQPQTGETPSSVSGSMPTVQVGESVPAESTMIAKTTTIQDATLTTTVHRVEIPTKNISDTSAQRNPIQTFYFNEIATLPPQDLDLDVYYSGKFSNDEKTVLERAVLPHLVNGDNVDYVNVYQKDAATIVIQLNYTDGTKNSFNYQVNDSGNWQLVQAPTMKAGDFSMYNSRD